MEPTPVIAEEKVDETAAPVTTETPVVTELLVEEISIDGMCGVY